MSSVFTQDRLSALRKVEDAVRRFLKAKLREGEMKNIDEVNRGIVARRREECEKQGGSVRTFSREVWGEGHDEGAE